jgi:Ca-activated chloride channel family protein
MNYLLKNTQRILFLSLVITFSCGYEDDGDTTSYNFNSLEGDTFAPAGDKYAELEENPFVDVAEQPVSTFSIDADGASYSNVRRFIQDDHQLPPKGAIRTEELINYFDLDYEYTSSSHPISLNGEVSECPWNVENKLIRIGIQGQPMNQARLASNFVFLIDVSGSMGSEDKLELLKNGFKRYVDELTSEDRVAIVTYAGSAGVTLNATAGNQKEVIKTAIDRLGSGGSTAGAQGIITAYEIAQQNFIEGGNNRIILGTDGDFNVGVSNPDSLVALIKRKRESGVYLTVLGVGRGNLNDASLEQIANNGNGTYEYVDNLSQLMKVFVYEQSKFYTVAKDVKVQVKFNPELVSAYRLIGYENRLLSEEDFEDDSEDAGEIGADQNITAIYEIVPTTINPLQRNVPSFTIDFRYKQPDSDTSVPMELEIYDQNIDFLQASSQMQFVGGIAAFSMLMTDSKFKGTATYDQVLDWLENSSLADEHGFKAELKELVIKARSM